VESGLTTQKLSEELEHKKKGGGARYRRIGAANGVNSAASFRQLGDLDNGLALDDQLLCDFALANNLLRRVRALFMVWYQAHFG